MRIYTDASSRGKLSGIAFIVTDAKDREIYKKGITIDEPDNNTAELCAILYALEDIQYLNVRHTTIFTDSWYAISAIRNGCARPKDNQYIKLIRHHMSKINSSLMWIKGHYRDGTALSYFNKRADKLSKVVRRKYEKELKQQKKKLRREIQIPYSKPPKNDNSR